MIDVNDILDDVKDFYREKKVLAIIITTLIVLFFLALIAFMIQSSKPQKTEQASPVEIPLNPDQKILYPDGPSIPDGYALTREPQERWTEEESEEYFTMPDSKQLEKLESDNDKLVNEILGATP
ncbi:MAG: hypothetical protein KBT21_00410 [Treponema sp.]|nr:hypothetical protein [Candidatus Treponema merdequi]